MADTIKLTEILGTDSISSSRLVINDNFRILSNELSNYKNYFDENGVYASNIITTSDNITLTVGEGQNAAVFGEDSIEFNKSLELNNGLTLNDDATFNNNVQIDGNLNIDGNFTVNGKEFSIDTSSHVHKYNDYTDLVNNELSKGWEVFYLKGDIINSENLRDRSLSVEDLFSLISPGGVTLPQEIILKYINKPIYIYGKNAYILANTNDFKRISTNSYYNSSLNILVPRYEMVNDSHIKDYNFNVFTKLSPTLSGILQIETFATF